MLKRQRPASPPLLPSFSETPCIIDPVDLGLIERHHKKPRTLPPSLDGTSRGWAKPHENHLRRLQNDDEEYYESGDDNDELEATRGNLVNSSATPSQPFHASPYKTTNQLLRELHTVNQHRLLFASPTPPPSLPSGSGLRVQQHQFGNQINSSNVLYQRYHQQQQQQLVSHQPSHALSNLTVNPVSPRCQEWHRSSTSSMDMNVIKDGPIISDEVSRVTERYESTNRLLGSLFLSRRKQLDDSAA